MELHIQFVKVYKLILHVKCQLKFWKFASKFTISNYVAETAQNTAFKALITLNFMFGGHIASKFAQISH